MKTIWKSLRFEVNGKNVTVFDVPELEGRTGIMSGDGMAFFFGAGQEFYVANVTAGTMRLFATADGYLLIDDKDIDKADINSACNHGYGSAMRKCVRYARLNRYDDFKKGLCALVWMLYPDGRYFADSDGFGMEDNDEEEVYAIIDTKLDILEPFRPVKDIAAYLKKIRM